MPWRTALLRGTKVIAHCDAAGELVAEAGKVEIRYRPSDGKSYRALLPNLSIVAAEPIHPDSFCAEALAGAAPKKPAKPGDREARRKVAADNLVEPVLSEAIVAYTDGACSGIPGPAGLGVVLLHAGQRRELSEYLGVGTNNIAELTAILRALEVRSEIDSELPLLVHTDSQYAIGVLTKGWKAKANQELIERIKQCIKLVRKLKLVYVPGHAGVPLNERADELAREAVSARRNAGWQSASATHA